MLKIAITQFVFFVAWGSLGADPIAAAPERLDLIKKRYEHAAKGNPEFPKENTSLKFKCEDGSRTSFVVIRIRNGKLLLYPGFEESSQYELAVMGLSPISHTPLEFSQDRVGLYLRLREKPFARYCALLRKPVPLMPR